MIPLRITAMTAISALGTGFAATRAALHARRGGLAPCTLPGMPPGIWTGRIADAALPPIDGPHDCRNNRIAEAALRADGFADAVLAARERHGAARVAVILGTSTSGIEETEQAYALRDAQGALPAAFDFAHSHDLHSLPRYVRARLGLRGPALSISTACTSGALTLLEAARMIAVGVADAVVAGGADSLCRLTLHGFASLELLARGACRPCAEDRNGICIGEAAGLVLLERAGPDDAGAIGLLGAGASSDGHHMSSPHPDGIGAVTAMRSALAAAGIGAEDIDHIAMHGTGTRANDAMEDRAIAQVFGDRVPASSTKGYTGHTLGASGALEAVMAALCIEDGLIPGCLNIEAADPGFASRIVVENRAARVDRVLKNAFGFGGSNVALVIGRLA